MCLIKLIIWHDTDFEMIQFKFICSVNTERCLKRQKSSNNVQVKLGPVTLRLQVTASMSLHCTWQFLAAIKVYLRVYFHWSSLEICDDPILFCKLTEAVLLSLYYFFSVTVQRKAFSDTWCPFLLLLHQDRQGGKWIAKSFPSAQFKGKISKFNIKIEFSSV